MSLYRIIQSKKRLYQAEMVIYIYIAKLDWLIKNSTTQTEVIFFFCFV